MSTNAIERLSAALTGRYRIEREVGEGGMARVYLARDLRHNRNVALKVLKPDLAAVVGADRFLSEIQTTANLQHPHILPLYDSGEADGFLFYVMPHVEGETLRERLDREKQLPVDEAVRIAVAVAGALDYAHQHGVVHRDIKPGNILMQAGQPVLGDFGIALAVGAASGTRLTETGLSVGTPYYMSPEQATGDQAVGPASDIYALGAVLYELLTGDPPYMGSTAQAVLGKILQGAPVSATAVRRSIPPNVDAAIRKALEKLPADRFTGASNFAEALLDPTFRHSEDAAAVVASPRMWQAMAAVTTVLAILFAAMTVQARNAPVAPLPIERYAVPFLEGEAPAALGSAGFDLSPDGTMLVYRHNPGDGQILVVRRWDELAATPVRETAGASNPAVSVDGLELAFQQDGEIKVLAFAGGPVRTLVTGTLPEWGPDGFVYATTDSGLVRVPSGGGAVDLVSRIGEGQTRQILTDVLPGGTQALVTVETGGGTIDSNVLRAVRLLDIAGGTLDSLVEGSAGKYVSSGHLTYLGTDGVLMAVRFDARKAEILGEPVSVLDGVSVASLSDDGKLFYSVGGNVLDQPLQLLWATRDGQTTLVDSTWTFARGGADLAWRISPDGSRIALRENTADGNDIWIKQLPAGPRTRLTFGAFEERMPEWIPGTQSLSFLSNRRPSSDLLELWSQPADGTRDAQLIVGFDRDIATAAWSPDGKSVALRTGGARGQEGGRDIFVFRPGVDSVPTPLLANPGYDEVFPQFSRDGKFIAYQSLETDRYEIVVRPFPDVSAGRSQVSVDGGRNPMWSHSGRELFFQGPTNQMMVVDVETGSVFKSGTPRKLFDAVPGWITSDLPGTIYDVAPDDRRFLIARPVAAGPITGPRTILVNNFAEELKAKVPN